MKKIIMIIMMVFLLGAVVACTPGAVEITLEVNEDAVSIKEGETHQLDIETNDEAGYSITVLNNSVAEVTSGGLVTALSVGSTTIKITSKTDSSKFVEVSLVVRKSVSLSLNEPSGIVWVGDSVELVFESNDDVTFESSNVALATVTNTGVVTALAAGNVTITMKSVTDSQITDSIELVIYDAIDTIVVSGEAKSNIGTKRVLNINVAPTSALPEVTWASSDETVATVDARGEVTFLKIGNVTITATALNSEVNGSLQIAVLNEVVVDQAKVLGDEVSVDGLTFVFGERLFSSLEAALDVSSQGTNIRLYDGEYDEAVSIELDDIKLLGMTDLVKIQNKLSIHAQNVLVDRIRFVDLGSIELGEEAAHTGITNNQFINLNVAFTKLINLNCITWNDCKGVKVDCNTFSVSY